MAASIKGITIEIGGSTQKLDDALKKVNTTSKSLKDQLKAVNNALKLDPKNIELAAKKQELLKSSIENTKEKLEILKQAQDKAREAFEKGEMSADSYRKLETEIINAGTELKKLEKDLKEAEKATDNLGSKFKEAGEKIQNAGKKIEGAGKALIPVSAAAAAVGAGAIKSAMELDEGYDTVITKTGAAGEALDSLKKSVDDTFGDLPTTAANAGIAVGEVNTRFGLTGEALTNLSKDFIRFAEINGTDLNNAIDSVDSVMTKFSVDSSETTKVLGLLTKAGQDTGISMDTLQNDLKTNGAVLKEMGLGLAQSVSLLAQFEASGVDSTTALAGLKKAQQQATKEGKTLDEALGETIANIAGAKSETEALQIATELFGKKGALEMTQAIREGRFSLEELTDSLNDYGTTVEDTFNATLNPWDESKVALNNLKIAGSDLAGEFLTSLQPTISSMVEKVKEFSQWFKSLDGDTKNFIMKTLLIVAALAPTLLAVGKLTQGIGGLTTTIGSAITKVGGLQGILAALTSPIGIVIAAIAALIAIFVYFYNTNDEFREKVNNALESLKEAFTQLVDSIKPLLATLKEAFDNLMQALQPVFDLWLNYISRLLNGIMAAVPFIISAITNIVQFFTNIINAITALFRGDIDGFLSYLIAAVQNAIGFVINIFKAWGAFLTTMFPEIWTTIQTVFANVSDFFREKFAAAVSAIRSVFTAVPLFFKSLWDKIVKLFTGVGQKIGDSVGKAFKAAMNGVFETVENIINNFIGSINGVVGILNKIPGVAIPTIPLQQLPRLAKGGIVAQGQAIVGEAGAELLTVSDGKAIVTPLSGKDRKDTISAAGRGKGDFIQNNYITSPKHLSPYEVARQTRMQTRDIILQLQGV